MHMLSSVSALLLVLFLFFLSFEGFTTTGAGVSRAVPSQRVGLSFLAAER